jgi:hypothetical protein
VAATLVVWLLVVFGSPVPRATAQSASDIAVAVHPGVPIDTLSMAELRRIVLGEREFWPSNIRIVLMLRAPVARERDVAVKTIGQMSEAQFRQHWIGKVFRAETPTGPKIVYSGEMAVDAVARTPGAMTFVDASAPMKGLKVLKIDGRLPGQTGYALR